MNKTQNSKSNKRKALGRGIANLIPTHSESEDKSGEIQDVDINAIDTNPYQPRIDFDDGEIAGLAESIKVQGLLQPIVLRKNGDRYQIISGERRFRAFRYLKRDCIQCIVRTNVTDKEMLELALVENIQREQLNEIEKALAYQKLILEFSYTHEELASQVGRSRSVITNALRLLNLPGKIQEMVRKNEISSGHARAVLALDTEEKQLEAARRIIEDKLTVRDVEQLAKPSAFSEKEPMPSKPKSIVKTPEAPDITNALEQLQYKFGTPIRLKTAGSGKGRVEIDYFSEDDLARVFDILLT
ncbi:MAG: ParB/RepB/Spo0J family partition protein [Chitinispirillales bacterium]|jgi:ParB family chromosome partitioning protein|nr:ParB/RepB/Spo0J family partition protein [Chitinispirillales bacterium]